MRCEADYCSNYIQNHQRKIKDNIQLNFEHGNLITYITHVFLTLRRTCSPRSLTPSRIVFSSARRLLKSTSVAITVCQSKSASSAATGRNSRPIMSSAPCRSAISRRITSKQLSLYPGNFCSFISRYVPTWAKTSCIKTKLLSNYEFSLGSLEYDF